MGSDLKLLIQDAEPYLEGMDAFDIPSIGAYHIAFDEFLSLAIQPATGRGTFVMTGDVGRPPKDSALKTYIFLMNANSIWEDTDGLRFALLADSGNVIMTREIGSNGLSARALGSEIGRFAEEMVHWAKVITEGKASLARVESSGKPEGSSEIVFV